MTDNSITGELLEEALEKTEEVIKQNSLSKAETTLLENQGFILRVMLIERRERQERRYRSFSRTEAFAMLIAAALLPQIISAIIKFLASLV